jgi:hypothetical protein
MTKLLIASHATIIPRLLWTPSRCAIVDAPLSRAREHADAWSSVSWRARMDPFERPGEAERAARGPAGHAGKVTLGTRSSLVGSELDQVAARSARLAQKRATSRPRATVTAILAPVPARRRASAVPRRQSTSRSLSISATRSSTRWRTARSSSCSVRVWPRAISGHFWHLRHYLNDHRDVALELQFSPRARASGLCGVGSAGDARACLSRAG